MGEVYAQKKSVRQLLDKVKYKIDYYQREYKWETKHIKQLLEDLESKFLDNYDESHERTRVRHYSHYFLGSVIINEKDNKNYIIDGQQRFTSLTLLLIYLNNLQYELFGKEESQIRELVYSEDYGQKSFNINVETRKDCLEALFKGENFDATEARASVRNMIGRYDDIVQMFPSTLRDEGLPYFIDWLKKKVDLVEIKTYSDEDAYRIFETMNDRGLRLTPTDMLKGYLLSQIQDADKKDKANESWKSRTLELTELGKGEEKDVFKSWLRGRYARTIRERKKGAKNKDFEKIGTQFHNWVRNNRRVIGLKNSSDFYNFIQKHFDKYSRYYLLIRKAAENWNKAREEGLEYVYYNGYNNFTLQYPIILSAINPEDNKETVYKKIRLVSAYIDIFITRRFVNFRTLGYSSIVYTMFNLIKELRDKDISSIADLLKEKIEAMEETFEGMERFHLHQQNRSKVHYLLARITSHIEEKSGIGNNFGKYIDKNTKNPFQVEHIWSYNFERHKDEFDSEEEFSKYRNKVGGLLLLPRDFNQSYGDDPYEKKVDKYFGQNLLAKSLNKQCYSNNPSFLKYIEEKGIPFKPHPKFKNEDLNQRQKLYRIICEEIWNKEVLDSIVQS